MPRKLSTFVLIRRIAAKEITLFFASPIAYLFLATFAAVTLFIFFWGEAFFARNIADVRPLFEWMPLLLIFLSSTLTMRLWSEERRTGTLEHVLTQPAPLWLFVLGKFFACMALLIVALSITLPLPVSVSLIGTLDWGPVWAGYLATLLLGAAYLSIGLFVSARSDNQIVSLISATALCGFFYLVGTSTVTDLFGTRGGEWLRLLGTGSRFESITRGVVDLRDLYYYISIVVVFLTLNIYALEKERWASQSQARHRRWHSITILLVINALVANVWLGQLHNLRIDTTAGKQYSISDATRDYLSQLQEPLLLRGYFSSKTHPLLAPLVPQLKDLMKEYEIAGQGRVRVEFIDPLTDPEREQEAEQKYGIKAIPFQMADRYESSIVSSYFNVLVNYGDEFQTLDFNDFVEMRALSEDDIEVQLRNPEYDLTSAIKKVLHAYRAGGNLFDTVRNDLTFSAYVSANEKLPGKLLKLKEAIQRLVDAQKLSAGDRLTIKWIDPDANDGAVGRQIKEEYGFKPMTTSVLSKDTFYFYFTLSQGDQIIQLPLGDMTEGNFKRTFESAIKRFASGFTKTVAYVTPPANPGMVQYGLDGGSRYTQLQNFLGAQTNLEREDLSDGSVSDTADILLLLSPENISSKKLFAIDQFLMRGGTVIAVTAPFKVTLANRSLGLQPTRSGLRDWLSHNGLTMTEQLIMDPQNSAFPIPVTRTVNGFRIQEMRTLDYPYFIDLRTPGLNPNHPITAALPQLTLSWASPITVNNDNPGRKISPLLTSSADSWLSESRDVMPRVTADGVAAYSPEGETAARLIGVISAGLFDSYFADKPSPLLSKSTSAENAAATSTSSEKQSDQSLDDQYVPSVINRSPESARIILISSNDFLNDQLIQLAGSASRSEYLNGLQLIANTVDWSLEDAGLLSIRARSHFNRTLPPIEHETQLFWEYLNYALAAGLLIIIAALYYRYKLRRQRRYARLLTDQKEN